MNWKNNKGINMITLSIAVIILVIITSVLVYNAKDGTKIKTLNNLYNDIEQLNNKVSMYYLEHGDLPKGAEYTDVEFINGLDSTQKNPNNEGKYYVINLNALEGVSLNYGTDFDKVETTENANTLKDLYIINEVSHTIYYPRGIKVQDKTYYTEPDGWEKIVLEEGLISAVSTEEDTNTTFPTDYGTIDVIWLSGTTNTVTTTPNAPVLTSNGESMTPVTWTYDSSTSTWSEDSTSQSTWYSYNAISTREASGRTTDNLTSMWANAKTANGAYFVWIPRYAYRITYYESETSTTPTGYYDGNGMWRASDGALKYALENGVETVTYKGKSYIVHPAFETNLDLGGWSSDLSGFWFAKYEMSGDSISELTSVPNVASKRSQSIGTQYLWGRQATYGYTGTSETLSSNGTNYTYTSYMSSHLMKNSEWGAVAYLTHSQYGRNGNEIDINNSNTYITGNGGGSTSASSASGTTNAYNTAIGAKASTTGNIYGVYDMSGGAYERPAAYNKLGSATYVEGTPRVKLPMTQEAKDASGNYESTKYITAYSNGTTSYSGNTIVYGVGKTGDATKEVNKGGNYTSTSIYYDNWNTDFSDLCSYDYPFFNRGYVEGNASGTGMFSSIATTGISDNCSSFRAVLCP